MLKNIMIHKAFFFVFTWRLRLGVVKSRRKVGDLAQVNDTVFINPVPTYLV